MTSFSNKELYMMNGGNKLYICKDSFGEVYNATVAEEALWAKDVVANALYRIETETNFTSLKFAIDDLLFHQYGSLETLLAEKAVTAIPGKSVVFAAALWKIYK